MLQVMRTRLLVGVFVLAAGPLHAQRRPITADEIDKAGPTVASAWDAVLTLRPRWLHAPREMLQLPGSGRDARMAEVRIYQDDHDVGGVDYLKSIPAERVAMLRWMSTNEAGSRFGPSLGPVIVVTLKH